MAKPISPPVANRSRDEGASPATPITYSPPITWFHAIGPGNVVLKDEAGTTVTYTDLAGGEAYVGPFTELTSFTCTRVRLGDGAPPVPVPPAGNAAGVTSADAGGYYVGTTVEEQLQEIGASLEATDGIIQLRPLGDFYLLTGAPIAIFADGASAVPGSAIVDSEAAGIRWNNNATLNGIMASFLVPPDADITANMTLHIHASKTGATVGDAVTFDVGCFNQVVGALHDADADFGGTTSAMTGDATAKTVQDVTLTLALANLAAYPASVTITIKPTDGTLGTDDLVLLSAFIVYKKKLTS